MVFKVLFQILINLTSPYQTEIMEPLKRTKIIFWTTTIILFLFQGVIPAFTSQSELAKEGIRHLGYPAYFGVALAVFKVIGSGILIIPNFSPRAKEWVYAGFAFEFMFAIISNAAVDGFRPMLLMPVAFLGILAASYVSFHKLKNLPAATV